MLLIRCPYCAETLPELEFEYSGEAHIARPQNPSDEPDDQWKDYLFIRSNVRGEHAEQWRHTHGCGRYFNALRNTVSDKFITTYPMGETRPDINCAGEEKNEQLAR
ncbi:Sarcosine oxidase, delta subunit family [Pseudovibrio axinellae]|uniref:Sarcosine oxidase, delta subunit family n=1 Tax=Pseudovibrio axinellae TaxID=989403 RepID=A0A165VTI3_9HYPH|nr:sarcosine oxidase subunit delta [Pseudovibrio axinellae]KZL15420.1 Sarcosine oxidase, delta subunit family [Pseudovibrio axinellae]SER55709.1 sarcosine oxidase subunit delta [Pseudovibrio axinellae]